MPTRLDHPCHHGLLQSHALLGNPYRPVAARCSRSPDVGTIGPYLHVLRGQLEGFSECPKPSDLRPHHRRRFNDVAMRECGQSHPGVASWTKAFLTVCPLGTCSHGF